MSARLLFDPSGFDCIHCALRYPWVASYNEKHRVHVCRSCRKNLFGVRHLRAKQNSVVRNTIASSLKIGSRCRQRVPE